jgi:hypothetical protein
MSFSKRLLISLGLLGLAGLYLLFFEASDWALYALIPVIVLFMVVYVSAATIDWWALKRNPPQLPGSIREMLIKFFPPYSQIPKSELQEFEEKLGLFVRAKDFIAKGIPDIPEDVKYLIAAQALIMSRHKENWLLEPYFRIVLYPHPFLSPAMPETAHTSELHEEDGVLIFSLEQLLPGFFSWGKYFNICTYEWAKAYYSLFPEERDELKDYQPTNLQKEFQPEEVKKFIGLETLDRPGYLKSLSHTMGD